VAVYAIGDVQGCYTALRKLLDVLRFDPLADCLWCVGDLVNRGPQSAEVLRFVMALPQVVVVLGNHDLHLLSVAAGKARLKPQDTLADILAAPDRETLLAWLRQRPLLHHDARLGYTMIHAGLLPQWSLDEAMAYAREAEAAIAASASNDLFDHLYGDLPDAWDAGLVGHDRLRVIINAFTRLRYCDTSGRMHLSARGAPGTQPAPFLPWFQAPGRRSRGSSVVFGHWSTLGVWRKDNVIALDSGCLWGGQLSAIRLDSMGSDFVSIPCGQILRPGKD
jgi:bis(5'-nucleosyl)-tetraphosphatase (symmetrical)